MITATFPAMGTTIEVRATGAHGVRAAARLFEDVEETASRFRTDSELSRINANPTPTMELSPLMTEVVQAADRMRLLTDGIVDAGVGQAVRDWGYVTTYSEVRDLETAPASSAIGGWHLEDNRLTRSPGTLLDLGGVAKGWTCDRAVETGLATTASAGGDLRSADPDTVAEVLDPWGEVATVIHVGVGALATSSTTRRAWSVQGRRAHHLIDPRTRAPSTSPVLSATALTTTAVEAEAAAKAVLLLGADGLAWADRQPWIRAAVAIWTDGAVYATGLEAAA
ncbi:MAG: FAD:protein FMN transferase [Acidimicrobiia bacterium]|nr:FAD:protein FMN transferase [Acidimicrobiia bacterium]NNC74462.1 FAD:protein FMN transferase [Acidimicrobiia bacterium]